MKDVKLTDFSEDELQTLLVEVVAACGKSFIEDYERFQILSLWRTQILNAISTVKMRNIPQQN